MPIEFRCTHCQRLLRTPDGTSGKEAKCPQCGAIVRIPAAPLATPSSAVLAEIQPRSPVANPYQAPAARDMQLPAELHATGRVFEPTRIEIGDILSRTWEIYKSRWLACLAVVWGTMIGMVIACSLVMVVGVAIVSAINRKPGPESILPMALMWLLIWFATVAMSVFMLRIARGEPVSFGDFSEVGPALLPGLGAVVLAGLASTLGFVLLIVPGVILMLMFSQCLYLVVDRKVGVIESLRLSAQATGGNKVTLLLLILLTTAIGGAINLLTCGVGTLLVQPFNLLALAVAYLAMTGQKVAVEPSAGRERPFGEPKTSAS